MAAAPGTDRLEDQRRRARRLAIVLGLVALAFYVGFIFTQNLRG